MIENYKKKPYLQLISLILFSIVLFSRFMSTSVRHINSTSFAFNYDYGFIPRGFMGSVYKCFYSVFDGLYSAYGLLIFTYITSIILFALVIGLIGYCYTRIPSDQTIYLTYICYFFLAFLVTTYVSEWNLGRLDTYCLMLSVIACFSIVAGKNIWICIPCAVIATLIHQGYVFMYANIILVLLLFCAIRNRDGKSKNYITVLALTFLSVSMLFLYMEFLSPQIPEDQYENLIKSAGFLNLFGEYHTGVINQELLGISIKEEEHQLLVIALKTMAVFVVLNIPYTYAAIRFFVKLHKSSNNKTDIMSYGILILGSMTIVPEFILKCDYGRWVMCIIAYYVITFLVASTIDNRIVDIIHNCLIPKNRILLLIFMAYIWLFVPLRDVLVCLTPATIAKALLGF